METTETIYASVLLNGVGFSKQKIDCVYQAIKPLADILILSAERMRQQTGLSDQDTRQLVDYRQNPLFQREVAYLQKSDVRVIPFFDERYPVLLKEIYFPPFVLYVRGNVSALSDFCIAMVGSRRASRYGLEVAEKFAYDFAQRGVTVVSGFARGIDTASCKGALHGRGKTVAVLGSGLQRMYPPENASLIEGVIQHQGAVISEFPVFTEPFAYNFPRRNRIISGLSKAVVVIEAAQRSGALITAACALEQNREVFAIPGPITTPVSEGTHALIKDGACLVRCPDDVLEELGYTGGAGIVMSRMTPSLYQGGALSTVEKTVYDSLAEEKSVEEIIAESPLDTQQVLHALILLRNKKAVEELPGKIYKRR